MFTRNATAARLILGLLVMGNASLAHAQVFAAIQGKVENPNWERKGTTVTVTYDLTSSDPAAVFKVTLRVWKVDKPAFIPTAVTGDIGDPVSPGKGKKIYWQVAQDTDDQDYNYEFAVVAVSGRLREVVADPKAPAAVPASTETSESPSEDLRGIWEGTYAGSPAQLTIDRRTETGFSGTLLVTTKAGKAPSELQVELVRTGTKVVLKEIRLVTKGAAPKWNLGSGSGVLLSDNRVMSGSGRDARIAYTWSLTRM